MRSGVSTMPDVTYACGNQPSPVVTRPVRSMAIRLVSNNEAARPWRTRLLAHPERRLGAVGESAWKSHGCELPRACHSQRVFGSCVTGTCKRSRESLPQVSAMLSARESRLNIETLPKCCECGGRSRGCSWSLLLHPGLASPQVGWIDTDAVERGLVVAHPVPMPGHAP